MKHAFSLIILLFASLQSLADTQEVKLVFEIKENPPYYLGNGPEIDWERPGITLSLLQTIEARLPVSFSYERVPWARALQMVKEGKAQGVFHSSYKTSREEIGVYPTSDGYPDATRQIMSQSYVIYKQKDKEIAWDGDQFSPPNLTIGAVIGYAVIDDLKSLGVKIEEVSSQSSGLEMLHRGRIDAWVDIETMSDARISRTPHLQDSIEKLSKPLTKRPYYLMFSHQFYDQHPKLAEAIWDTIKEIHSSEQYGDISKRYLAPK